MKVYKNPAKSLTFGDNDYKKAWSRMRPSFKFSRKIMISIIEFLN